MPRAIVFDFDGVILDSVDIKTRAFAELFAEYPEHVDAIVRHHLENLGISRYQKFEWVYRELLRRPLNDAESRRLGGDFTRIVWERLLECPFVPGAREALEALRPGRRLYVASGTPHEELLEIVKRRGLESAFDGVWGAPRPKPEVVRDILAVERLRPDEVLFVGDGLSDLAAARATGVRFVARAAPHDRATWADYDGPRVESLIELPALVKRMEATA